MDNPEKLATRRRKRKQKHSTICVWHHYSQANANNVNKTWDIIQATGSKTIRTSLLCGNRHGHHNTELTIKYKYDHNFQLNLKWQGVTSVYEAVFLYTCIVYSRIILYTSIIYKYLSTDLFYIVLTSEDVYKTVINPRPHIGQIYLYSENIIEK